MNNCNLKGVSFDRQNWDKNLSFLSFKFSRLREWVLKKKWLTNKMVVELIYLFCFKFVSCFRGDFVESLCNLFFM